MKDAYGYDVNVGDEVLIEQHAEHPAYYGKVTAFSESGGHLIVRLDEPKETWLVRSTDTMLC